jgi:hypothetical protein
MRVGVAVSWDRDVFPCWRRSANNALRPNSDVWRPLPSGTAWFEAEVEPGDISCMFLIGSSDLLETFGSYRLSDIVRVMNGDDRFNHRSRIRSLSQSIRDGCLLERPIVVSQSDFGPFVIIDGNHRCLAYYSLERLPGLQVYLGKAPDLLSAYPWARSAQSGGYS